MLVSTMRGDAIAQNFTRDQIAQGIAADFKGSGAQSRLFNNIPGRGDYSISGINPQPLKNAAAEAQAAKDAGYVIEGLGGDARAAGEAIASSAAKSAGKNVGQEIVGGLESAGKAVSSFFEKESGNILKGLFEGAGFGSQVRKNGKEIAEAAGHRGAYVRRDPNTIPHAKPPGRDKKGKLVGGARFDGSPAKYEPKPEVKRHPQKVKLGGTISGGYFNHKTGKEVTDPKIIQSLDRDKEMKEDGTIPARGGTMTGGHVEDERRKNRREHYSATQDSGTQAHEYNRTHQANRRVDPGMQKEVRNQHAPRNRDGTLPMMNMGQSTQGGAVKQPIPQYDYHKDYGMHVGDNERRRMQRVARSGAYGLDELQAQSHEWHAKIAADQISKGGSIGSGGSVIPEPVRKDLLETRSQEHYFGRAVAPPRAGPEAEKMQRSKHSSKPLHNNVDINNPDLTRRDITRIRMGEYNPNLHPRGNPGRPHHVKMRPHHAFADPNKASAGTIR
jgi:hypothetical protein